MSSVNSQDTHDEVMERMALDQKEAIINDAREHLRNQADRIAELEAENKAPRERVMGLVTDKLVYGALSWTALDKNANDRGIKDTHTSDDVGILWAADHIATQAATIEALRRACEYTAYYALDNVCEDVRAVAKAALDEPPPADTGESK